MTTRASDALLRKILTETKTIALVGASNKPHRDSNGVMRFLQSKGYRVIPINPGLAGQSLNGETVYATLKDIPQDKTGRIDMVDIFRNSADAAAPALEAIEIGAKFVWMQVDVVNEPAAERVRHTRKPMFEATSAPPPSIPASATSSTTRQRMPSPLCRLGNATAGRRFPGAIFRHDQGQEAPEAAISASREPAWRGEPLS